MVLVLLLLLVRRRRRLLLRLRLRLVFKLWLHWLLLWCRCQLPKLCCKLLLLLMLW